jgi:HupE / UreJ protein
MNKTRGFFEQEAAEGAEPNRNHRLLMAEVSSAFSALSVISCSILLFLLFVSSAFAHEVRPAYLELRQTGPGTYAALWKVPGQGENMRLGLYVELPAGCTNVTAPRASMANNAFTERWTVKRAGGLTGGTIHIAGLTATMTDVLVRMERLDGTTQVTRLTPSAPSFVVEAAPRALAVARTYLALGVEHILLGIDHLLFVLGLLLIVGQRWGLLLKTITAFTLAHSITLALATLGFVHVPQAPVEAVIALSIMFVASEILRMPSAGFNGFNPLQGLTGRSVEASSSATPRRELKRTEVRAPSLTARAPWVVAFTFGLLHGFGFAGALSEVGLPQNSVPLALLFFNVGVEIGQLLFVAAAITFIAALGRVRITWPKWTEAIPPYAIGACAAFWTIQRTLFFYGF